MSRTTGLLGGALFAAVVAVAVIGGSSSWAATSVPSAATTSTPVNISVTIPGSPTPTPTRSHGSGQGSPSHSPGAEDSHTGAPEIPSKPGEKGEGLDLDHESIPSGKVMVATGSGFDPGEEVQLVLYSTPVVIGSYTADANGNFSTGFRIPAGTRSGSHTAEATGWASGRVANKEFVVVTEPVAVGGLALIWWLVIILAVLTIATLATAYHFRRSIGRWVGHRAAHEGGGS